MKRERYIERILSGISIRPDEEAKRAAFDRMMARHAEAKTELSEYDLEGVAAAGLLPKPDDDFTKKPKR